MACKSERIAAIASVEGGMRPWLIEDDNIEREIPVLIIHGTNDKQILYEGEEDWIPVEDIYNYWCNINACTESDTLSLPDLDTSDGCTVEKITSKNNDTNISVVFYKVINGGHTWPSVYYPPWDKYIGNVNKDINGDEVIWNFFKNYELPDEVIHVESDSNSPIGFSLSQNYPNPFNSITTIEYSVPCGCRTSLKVYNTSGQLVETLKNEMKSPGRYSATWDASGMPSGIYFCTLKSGNFVQTKSILFLK